MAESNKHKARVAGLWYLAMGFTAPIGLIYVPGKLIVAGDAAATADRIRAAEWLFRIGMATEVFHQVVSVWLVLALYRLFKPVSEKYSLLMVILSVLGVPIVLLNTLNEFAALTLIHGGPFLSTFTQAQLDSFAFVLLKVHSQGLQLATIFWGLWLLPFGILVMRSGFIPRTLGVILLIAGFGYLPQAAASLAMPEYAHLASHIAEILGMGEMPMLAYLRMWGARDTAHAQAA